MSTAAIVAELRQRGIELQAHGDRLRFRPKAAATPELVRRMQAHKTELLALLGQGGAPECPAERKNQPVANAAPAGGRVVRPTLRECVHAAPHEPSLAERVETGYVNPGWTPAAWVARLIQLADRCEALRPGLAAQYRTWAQNVERPADGETP